MTDNIEDIVLKIKAGDELAFERVFKTYYPALHNLARGILKDSDLAEEQVQEVFIRLWELRDVLRDDLKLFPYLIASVRNRCYNLTRHQEVKQKYITYQRQRYREEILNYEYEDLTEEIINKMHEAVNRMPDKCREVFKLSRFEGLSHKEIGERLSISTKTVENHITKAMKILKAELIPVSHIILILILGELL